MKWHLICLIIVLINLSPVQSPVEAVCRSDNHWPQVSVDCLAGQSDFDLPSLLLNWQAVVWAYAARPGRVNLCRWRLVWRVSTRGRGRPVPRLARRRRLADRRRLSKPAVSPKIDHTSPVAPVAQSCQAMLEEQSSSDQSTELPVCATSLTAVSVPQAAEGSSEPVTLPAGPPSALSAEVIEACPEPASATLGVELATDTSTLVKAPVVQKATRVHLSQVLRPGVLLTGHGLQLRPFVARLGDTLDEYKALWDDHEHFKASNSR